MINHNALIKIIAFELLEPGWCYGEGVPIKKSVSDHAQKIFYALFKAGVDKTDAFPGLNGEIRVTGYDGVHYFEFTTEENNLVTYLYEQSGQEKVYLEDIQLSDAIKSAVETITSIKSCQSSSEQYIKYTGIKSCGDFKVWPLILHEMVGFQSFALIAQQNQVGASALTSMSITKRSPVIRQSIGRLINPYSRVITKSSKPKATRETCAIVI